MSVDRIVVIGASAGGIEAVLLQRAEEFREQSDTIRKFIAERVAAARAHGFFGK